MFAQKIGLRFVEILPGRFLMGSPDDEIGREPDETLHAVKLTKPFLIADTPINNAQYRSKDPTHRVPQQNGVELNGDSVPCSNVSLKEALEFCSWMSDQDQVWRYDLPTEAEWEYSARAGNGGRFFWGEDELQASRFANIFDIAAMDAMPSLPRDGFAVNDGFIGPSPVRQFRPNAFGLYDTIGNVWEFCKNRAYKYPTVELVDPQGPTVGDLYCVRGGDWLSIPFFARSANRTFMRLNDRSNTVGFRIIARERRLENPLVSYSTMINAVEDRPTWNEIRQLFTDIDIDHMKLVSERWRPPLLLDDYESVRRYSMKIYSSVRTDSMPTPPVPHWSSEAKNKFRLWMYAGHPR